MSPQTLTIYSTAIACKLEDLHKELEKVEKTDGFKGWFNPPLEQLDASIGSMVDPNSDTIPPTILYYEKETVNECIY